jgi:hypothetical protein
VLDHVRAYYNPGLWSGSPAGRAGGHPPPAPAMPEQLREAPGTPPALRPSSETETEMPEMALVLPATLPEATGHSKAERSLAAWSKCNCVQLPVPGPRVLHTSWWRNVHCTIYILLGESENAFEGRRCSFRQVAPGAALDSDSVAARACSAQPLS